MQQGMISPRPALKNVTNNAQRIQGNFNHCNASDTHRNAKFKTKEVKNGDFSIARLSDCSAVENRSGVLEDNKCSRPRPSYTDLLANPNDCSVVKASKADDSNFLHPGSIIRPPLTTLAGPQRKRARCETTQPELKLQSSGSQDNGQLSKATHSNLCSDIVRISLRKRIRLEQLLAECRAVDYALCALDEMPVERMLEASDQLVSIFAYEQLREAKPCYAMVDFLSGARRKQPCLTPDMLVTLADWLIDIHETFSLNHVTLHLAWSLVYTYLGRGRSLQRREVQLIACAATMLAAKFEERQGPRLKELLYITDDAYVINDLLRAERELLVTVDYSVNQPNPYMFLRRFGRILDAQDAHVQYMARFLLEAGMHSHCISLQPASLKAATVLWLSRVVVRNPSYNLFAKRSDVIQLKQAIRSNPLSQAYYMRRAGDVQVAPPFDFFSSSSSSFRSSTSYPPMAQFFTANSGALDLTVSRPTSSTATSAESLSDNTPKELESGSQTTSIGSAIHDGLDAVSTSTCTLSNHDDQFASLDSYTKNKIDRLRYEDSVRRQFWPPILEHITGYTEVQIIPLATRYHWIALRLVAEVARGGRLAEEAASKAAAAGTISTDADGIGGDFGRCVSPGGHQLRRQAVSKYCSSLYLHVANAYPQLAFENLVPHFSFLQCKKDCRCFICTNLIRTD